MFSMIGRGPLSILLLLLLLTGLASPVFALDFSAFWLYRERGGDAIDTSRELQQSYRLGAGPSLTYQPTQAIMARFFLDYSRSQRNLGGDQGWVTVDSLTPSADLSLTNDIFRAQLGGFVTQTQTSASANVPTTRSWNAGLFSAWQIPFWPSLGLSYNERAEEARISDTLEKSTSISVNWDLLLAQLSYQNSRTESEDRISGSLSTSDSHFARLETDGQFWQKRVRFDLAQQAQIVTQDFSLGTLQEDFDEKPGLASAKVDTATGPNPTDLAYVDPDPAAVLPLDVGFNERVHIRFRFAAISPEQLDLLRLTMGASLDVQAALNLQWALFFRRNVADPNVPDPWEPAPGPFQVVLSTVVENSIEIRLDNPIEAAEILLVATNDSGSPLNFTALRAFTRLTQDTSSRTSNYLTNLTTSIRFTPTLSASSSLSLEKAHTEAAGSSSDSSRLAVSGRLGWSPTPFFSPSLGFSQTREEATGEEDLISRAYSLVVSSIPLPTLNLALGATRTERFSADVKTQTSDNFSLTTAARIYPDLNAAMNLSYRTSERLDSAGLLTTTDSYGGRLNLNARINPALTSDFTTDYQHTASATGQSSSSLSTLSLLYRPSAILSMRVSGSKSWVQPGQADSLDLNLNLGLLRTAKTRMTFRYTRRQAEDASDNFGLDWSWDISRLLYLQSKFNYVRSQTDVYNIDAFLSLKL
jgi:hypothetical protein